MKASWAPTDAQRAAGDAMIVEYRNLLDAFLARPKGHGSISKKQHADMLAAYTDGVWSGIKACNQLTIAATALSQAGVL